VRWTDRRRSKIIIRIDGREAEIDSARIDDPESTAKALIRLLREE
jgi:hypothetical protein